MAIITNDSMDYSYKEIFKKSPRSIFRGEIPETVDYYANLNVYATISIIVAIIVFFLNVAIFLSSVMQSLKRVRREYLASTLFLLGIYPTVSLASLITILVPKSVLICHTVKHLMFVLGAFVYYRLCILYMNGLENFLKEADSKILNMRTQPLCCCCVFFRPIAATKTRMNILFYMIAQLPVVQFVIMIALNFIYVYDEPIFENCNYYFMPFMFVSIFTAVWCLNIITRAVDSHVENHNMRKKFRCLQLVLIFCKLQYIVLNLALKGVYLGSDNYPITDTVYKNAIINLIILFEMFLLSIIAKQAYREPTHL